MPLFIRALPLSLQTFWRYLLILPFMGIAALLLLPLMFVPFLGLLIPGAITAGFTLMGLRCALAAKGHIRLGHLAGFTTLALAYSAIVLVGGSVAGLLEQAVGWVVITAGIAPDPDEIVAQASRFTPLSIAIWVGAILPKLMLASLLTVPMTAAAAAADWRKGNLLFGLGAGMLGLCVPLVAWLILGNSWAFFGEIWTISFIVAGGLFDFANMRDLLTELLSKRHFLISMIGMAWASSWFFASAVLYWERELNRAQNINHGRVETQRVSIEDIRGLRLAREHRQQKE